MVAMKPESSENQLDSFPKISEAMISHMLQIRLMPLAYKIDHPETEVHMSDKDSRTEVGMEWASKYANAFREYIEDHPRETVNLHDEDGLIEFFIALF